MLDVLHKIEEAGGSDDLVLFLRKHQPSALVENQHKELLSNKVFPEYVPGLLTYPHRQVFNGSRMSLESKVKSFVKDKLVHEYLIIDDVAYVEFLLPSEKSLIDKIPESNWHIRTYRKNKQKFDS